MKLMYGSNALYGSVLFDGNPEIDIGKGWTHTLTSRIVDGQLNFSSVEMLTNKRTYTDSSVAVHVEADFVYNGIDIGLILWYNNTGYIKYILSPDEASIFRYYDNNILLLDKNSDDKIIFPETGDLVTLKAILYKTNIKCYLNDQNIFNFEQMAFSNGSFGISGTTGAKCTKFKVRSNKLSGWNRNLKEGCFCISKDNSLYFNAK